MNSRKLRSRLMVTIISLLSCIAIMAVGVYAAQSSFEVTVNNVIDIEIATVNGTLSGKRVGDVVLGANSLGDEGIEELIKKGTITAAEDVAGEIPEFITLYENNGYGYQVNQENMARMTEKVNFYLSAVQLDENGEKTETKKDELTISYVFKFDFFSESPSNVTISMQNLTTQLTDSRADYVNEEFKYYFGATEPDWDKTAGVTSFGIDGSYEATKSITVEHDKTNTHTVYMLARLTVKRTDTLATAYTLGLKEDVFIWGFSLKLIPEVA